MVGWHHRLSGHEFEQTLGVGDGQGSLACCIPWGRKELDTTEQLNTAHYEVCTGLTQIWHQSPVCFCENYLTSLGQFSPSKKSLD